MYSEMLKKNLLCNHKERVKMLVYCVVDKVLFGTIYA